VLHSDRLEIALRRGVIFGLDRAPTCNSCQEGKGPPEGKWPPCWHSHSTQVLVAIERCPNDLIRERVGAGIARACGEQFGRPRRVVNHEEIHRLRSAGARLRQIAAHLRVGQGTVRRQLRNGRLTRPPREHCRALGCICEYGYGLRQGTRQFFSGLRSTESMLQGHTSCTSMF
jgi:hypothetical protein